MPVDPTILEYWYTALRSPAGCKVRVLTGSVDLMLAKLYAARAESLDENLKTLSIVRSRTVDNEVWIVHREAPDGTQANGPGTEESDDALPSIELPKDG